MRFDPSDSFGYPVLRPGNDDYVLCEIQSRLNAVADTSLSSVTVTYKVSIFVPEIIQLISEKKVELVIYGECRDTWFDIIQTIENEEEGSFSITDHKIDGEFELTCLVVAKEKITSYKSNKFNKEYGDMSFDIEKGEILAFDDPKIFYINRDALRNITSLFDYSESEDLSIGEWDVFLEEDRIKVLVNRLQLPICRSAEGTNKNKAVLLAGLFLPIVVQIINEMSNSPEEYSERRWFKIIESRMEALPPKIRKSTVLTAQYLLKMPLLKLNTAMEWAEQ